MPENPKLFIHNVPIEICTSVQRGLPFVHTMYMEMLLKGILAAAQSMFPITICHLIIMANHIHLLAIVQNPEDVPKFMDYFKTEVAHAVNRLMGTTGQSFWVSGYDSPSILSAEKFLERMEYLYLNPVKAKIVRSSCKYQGLSTHKLLSQQTTVEEHKKVSREQLKELPRGSLSKSFQSELVRSFREGKGCMNVLKIEPWAWLKCYEESKDWNTEAVQKRFLTQLEESEERLKRQNPSILGKASNQNIRIPYRSRRYGLKMICLSDCPKQRSSFISTFKALAHLARVAYQLTKQGIRTSPPPGFFLPGGALLANLVLTSSFLY